MLKSRFVSLTFAICCFVPFANAQLSPQILKSPVLASSRACLDGMSTDGKKSHLYVDRAGVESMVADASKQKLVLILGSSSACLDAAFPSKEVVQNPDTKVRSRIWFAPIDGQYIWCASNSLGNEFKNIETIGGNGPKKNWYAVYVHCGIGAKVMDWYSPS